MLNKGPSSYIKHEVRRGRISPAIKKAEKLKTKWRQLCERFLPIRQPGSLWRYNRPLRETEPSEGWKVHISATILTACETLKELGPLFLDKDVPFKAASTLDDLRKLNSGIWFGYGQIGKFLTAYPRDENEFISLCRQAHILTSKIEAGPVVPFDQRYAPNGNIYYRYGPFRTTASARILGSNSAIAAAFPPFDNGSQTTNPDTASIFSGRYHVFRSLSQRGKGGVYEALDMSHAQPRLCIIKEGRRNGETIWDRRDGFDRISNEAKILTCMSDKADLLPAVIDRFEEAGNVYLVLEKIEGITMDKILRTVDHKLSNQLAFHLSTELARIVSKLHSKGIVWRDCKPSNLILERSGRLRAIDLESASSVTRFDPFVWSTPLFAPPEASTGIYLENRASNLPEDLFALGTCLYLFLEGRMPFPDLDLRKPIAMSRISDRKVRGIVGSLLSPDPDFRPKAEEVYKTLKAR
jgi:hypothetical protein